MLTMQQAKDPKLAAARAQSVCNAVKNNILYTMIVEPSGKCNLACTFCDLHSGRIEGTEQLKGLMTEETFARIVDQLAEMPFVLKELQYHGNGEPLLNKNLPDFVRYAKSRGVAEKHRLTTNGTMLTQKNLVKVIEAGIDEIHVSLDVADREGYKDLKGCDLYGKVDANLDTAIAYMEQQSRCVLYIKHALPHRDGDYSFTKEISDAVIQKYRARGAFECRSSQGTAACHHAGRQKGTEAEIQHPVRDSVLFALHKIRWESVGLLCRPIRGLGNRQRARCKVVGHVEWGGAETHSPYPPQRRSE